MADVYRQSSGNGIDVSFPPTTAMCGEVEPIGDAVAVARLQLGLETAAVRVDVIRRRLSRYPILQPSRR